MKLTSLLILIPMALCSYALADVEDPPVFDISRYHGFWTGKCNDGITPKVKISASGSSLVLTDGQITIEPLTPTKFDAFDLFLQFMPSGGLQMTFWGGYKDFHAETIYELKNETTLQRSDFWFEAVERGIRIRTVRLCDLKLQQL